MDLIKRILQSAILFGVMLLLIRYTNIFRISPNKRMVESYNNLINNSKITIGEFWGITFSNGFRESYVYRYYVDGKRYAANDPYYVGSDLPENFKPTNEDMDSARKGNKYLVLYDPSKLATKRRLSLCLLSYPIKDSSDFAKYSKEVEEKILKNRGGVPN